MALAPLGAEALGAAASEIHSVMRQLAAGSASVKDVGAALVTKCSPDQITSPVDKEVLRACLEAVKELEVQAKKKTRESKAANKEYHKEVDETVLSMVELTDFLERIQKTIHQEHGETLDAIHKSIAEAAGHAKRFVGSTARDTGDRPGSYLQRGTVVQHGSTSQRGHSEASGRRGRRLRLHSASAHSLAQSKGSLSHHRAGRDGHDRQEHRAARPAFLSHAHRHAVHWTPKALPE